MKHLYYPNNKNLQYLNVKGYDNHYNQYRIGVYKINQSLHNVRFAENAE